MATVHLGYYKTRPEGSSMIIRRIIYQAHHNAYNIYGGSTIDKITRVKRIGIKGSFVIYHSSYGLLSRCIIFGIDSGNF